MRERRDARKEGCEKREEKLKDEMRSERMKGEVVRTRLEEPRLFGVLPEENHVVLFVLRQYSSQDSHGML